MRRDASRPRLRMTDRLPAHLEVASLRRLVEAEGGTAMVLARGERDAGTILVVTQERGAHARLFERMPQLDGTRRFTLSRGQSDEDPDDFTRYLDRRRQQDPDCWILEMDVDDAERLVALLDR